MRRRGRGRAVRRGRCGPEAGDRHSPIREESRPIRSIQGPEHGYPLFRLIIYFGRRIDATAGEELTGVSPGSRRKDTRQRLGTTEFSMTVSWPGAITADDAETVPVQLSVTTDRRRGTGRPAPLPTSPSAATGGSLKGDIGNPRRVRAAIDYACSPPAPPVTGLLFGEVAPTAVNRFLQQVKRSSVDAGFRSRVSPRWRIVYPRLTVRMTFAVGGGAVLFPIKQAGPAAVHFRANVGRRGFLIATNSPQY